MSASLLQAQQLERAVAVMREGIGKGDVNACVLAVADSQRIIRLETASAEGGFQAQPDSIFLLASITKPFMGTAIMQLVEQGRVLLIDQVQRYIPEFAVYGKEGVTIWHLLTHTAGLAEEVEMAAWMGASGAAGHLEAACRAFLHFAPGSAYEYCNTSFWILGEIIARVSGLTYPEYIRQHILAPLGMVDSGFSFEDERAGRVAPVLDKGGMPPMGYFCSICSPAGGLHSTAADMVKFGQAILNGYQGRGCPILSKAAIRTMTAEHTRGIMERGQVRQAAYGLGWAKPPLSLLSAPSSFGHGGATATLLWVEPEQELVYVFLTNVWGGGATAQQAFNAVMAAL